MPLAARHGFCGRAPPRRARPEVALAHKLHSACRTPFQTGPPTPHEKNWFGGMRPSGRSAAPALERAPQADSGRGIVGQRAQRRPGALQEANEILVHAREHELALERRALGGETL